MAHCERFPTEPFGKVTYRAAVQETEETCREAVRAALLDDEGKAPSPQSVAKPTYLDATSRAPATIRSPFLEAQLKPLPASKPWRPHAGATPTVLPQGRRRRRRHAFQDVYASHGPKPRPTRAKLRGRSDPIPVTTSRPTTESRRRCIRSAALPRRRRPGTPRSTSTSRPSRVAPRGLRRP